MNRRQILHSSHFKTKNITVHSIRNWKMTKNRKKAQGKGSEDTEKEWELIIIIVIKHTLELCVPIHNRQIAHGDDDSTYIHTQSMIASCLECYASQNFGR